MESGKLSLSLSLRFELEFQPWLLEFGALKLFFLDCSISNPKSHFLLPTFDI